MINTYESETEMVSDEDFDQDKSIRPLFFFLIYFY